MRAYRDQFNCLEIAEKISSFILFFLVEVILMVFV